MKTIRVFPRRTNATPDDEFVRIGTPPGLFDEADAVEISVTFTWDIPAAEKLARQWEVVAPVTIGGPATGQRGEEFTPGKYIKHGYTISSRGCNNTHCWFCSVPKRDGKIRELPITDGFNLLDDNLLQCSRPHIEAVFAMLQRQKQPAQFTGGMEAKRLEPWHVDLISKTRIGQMFFAYDDAEDYEPLVAAGKMLEEININYKNRKARAYVLCGYPKDTFDSADIRMRQTVAAGFMPMAMLYRGADGSRKQEWVKWQRQWARPAIIATTMKKINENNP